MATVSVRINQDLIASAKRRAAAEFRTTQGQLEFWALVGRAALDNPDLPATFIADSLMSMAEAKEETTPFEARSLTKK